MIVINQAMKPAVDQPGPTVGDAPMRSSSTLSPVSALYVQCMSGAEMEASILLLRGLQRRRCADIFKIQRKCWVVVGVHTFNGGAVETRGWKHL